MCTYIAVHMCTHVCNKFTFSQGHNIATVRYTLQALSCAPESYIFRKRERVCVYRARVTNRNGYCSYKRKAYHGEVTVADFRKSKSREGNHPSIWWNTMTYSKRNRESFSFRFIYHSRRVFCICAFLWRLTLSSIRMIERAMRETHRCGWRSFPLCLFLSRISSFSFFFFPNFFTCPTENRFHRWVSRVIFADLVIYLTSRK